MTNTIIQNLTNEQLLVEIQNLNLSQKQMSQKIRRRNAPLEIIELCERTRFLEKFYEQIPILCRIHCLKNNIVEIPKCANPKCSNNVKWQNGVNQFSKYCCHKCSTQDPNFWNRVHSTMNERYNGIGMGSHEIRQKIEQTCIDRFGNKRPIEVPEIKQKAIETTIRHYGVSCSLLAPQVQEMIRITMLKRYKSSHFSKSIKFKELVQNSWKRKSKTDLLNINLKREETTKKRYGVKNVFQSEEIKERIKETLMEKLSVKNPMQSEDIKQKFAKTMVERYNGIGFQSNEINEKITSTMMEKYNVHHTFESKELMQRLANSLRSEKCQSKMKQTFLSKYKVEYYTQSEQYHKNKIHKYHSEKYPELTFDSTWEVKVYEFCKDNNIEVEYSPAITYKYEYDGRIWTYHPDFLINGKVYEVKGDQFFRINESTGKEEMFCPYRYDDWSDEHYNWMCGKYEAKHQCMLKNNVIILRKIQMNSINISF